MDETETPTLADQIINKARILGASLAGIASVELLKKSPSHGIYEKIDPNQGVGSRDFVEGVEPGEIAWPPAARSALVIALAHKEDDPQLDWWVEYEHDRESRGCQIIEGILKETSEWAAREFGLNTYQLPYHIEKGGIFFKDAGVLAGMGCIGKNNLLVTPEYGPRVRVGAVLLDEVLPSTGPLVYDPCDGCHAPCRQVCPRNAFDSAAHSPIEMGMITLPGKDGWYDREVCRPETEKNIENKEFIKLDGYEKPMGAIKFCRLCELSCPVGKE